MRDADVGAHDRPAASSAGASKTDPDEYAYLDGDVNERLEAIAAEMQAALPDGTTVDGLLDAAMRDVEDSTRTRPGPGKVGEEAETETETMCPGYQDVLLVGYVRPPTFFFL